MDTSSVLVLSTSTDWSGWGNVVVTAIAVGAAIYAGYQARALLRIEVKRELDRDLSMKREQAKQISAWSRSVLNAFSNNSHYTNRAIEAVVVNQSQQAIYDVRLRWWFSGELEHQSRVDLVPPGESMTFDLPPEYLDKFSGEVNFVSFVEPIEDARENCMAICDLLRIGVSFKDAENREWLRDQEGLLRQN
jgi:hypothetical protein